MELNTEHMDLKINGVEFKLELVTYAGSEKILGRIEEIQAENAEDGRAILHLKGETLLGAGLPKDILGKLQMKHVNEIFDGLCGVKND